MMKKNRKAAGKKRKRRKIKRTESQDSRLRARRMTKTRENKGAPRRSTEMAKVAIDAEETNTSLNMKREKMRKAEEALKQESLTGTEKRTQTAEANKQDKLKGELTQIIF